MSDYFPAIRFQGERLVDQARRGGLVPGGEIHDKEVFLQRTFRHRGRIVI